MPGQSACPLPGLWRRPGACPMKGDWGVSREGRLLLLLLRQERSRAKPGLGQLPHLHPFLFSPLQFPLCRPSAD